MMFKLDGIVLSIGASVNQTHFRKVPMNVKSILIAITLSTLGFSSYAQIPPIEGISTNHSTSTASLIILTNKPATVSGSNYTYQVGKAKITNKQLLNLFAAWSTNLVTTNWPT